MAKLQPGRYVSIMATRLLEFVSESFWFDDSALKNRYASFGEVELFKELENYRALQLSDAVADLYSDDTA